MKTQISLSLTILILLSGLLTSCEKLDEGIIVTGTGPMVQETIETAEFSNVEVDVDAIVYLTQGIHKPLRITGQANILSLLEVSAENKTLKINYPDGIFRHEKLEIYINVPMLEHLSTARGAQFRSLNAFGSDLLVFQVYGAGQINMQISQANQVRTWITGTGTISLEGNADMLDVVVNGSGSVLTSNLMVQNSHVTLTGSGQCQVFSSEALTVNINGSGKVYYAGNPAEVHSSLAGSGELKKLE